jgi:nicotinamidase-related amidase
VGPSAEHYAAGPDSFRICLVLIDVQNTFCIPGYELFVGGRSGNGAVEDSHRLCRFIYHNLHRFTEISPTLDSHTAMQIFHPPFFVDEHGNHPQPYTMITPADIREGRWRFNAAAASTLGLDVDYVNRFIQHYTDELALRQKYALTIWPYHAMLGGISHALVSAVEEAIFFHSIARASQPDFEIKGLNPLTEHYSALGPEITTGPDGERVAHKDDKFLQKLHDFDAVIIAGQAKSHCVAWTIEDLLGGILETDPALARKVYLLDDCTSSVVIPDVFDYSVQAAEAFEHFAGHGMNLVQSTTPMDAWPGMGNG